MSYCRALSVGSVLFLTVREFNRVLEFATLKTIVRTNKRAIDEKVFPISNDPYIV